MAPLCRLLLSVAFVALLYSPRGVLGQTCDDHDVCTLGTYCSNGGVCVSCSLCESAGNSIDDCDVCDALLEPTREPGSGSSCRSHSGCAAGIEYCDTNNECFACSGCILVNDAVDGMCPTWCFLQPGSGGNRALSQQGDSLPSKKASSGSHLASPASTLATVLIVAVVVFVLLVATVVVSRNRWQQQRKRIDNVLSMHEEAESRRLGSFRRDVHQRGPRTDMTLDGFEMDDALSGVDGDSAA